MKNYMLLLVGVLCLFTACKKDQLETDEEIIKTYIEENNLDAIRHSSGLYYVIEQPGSGGSPTLASEVEVRYKGYFLDGNVFDETDGNATISFPLTNVIVGWQIGIPLFQKGGKGILLIPSNLAYGVRGRGQIPPNTVLGFDIELVGF